MNKLPIEMINKIISYTYNIQSEELLQDIRNYYETRNIVFDKIFTSNTRKNIDEIIRNYEKYNIEGLQISYYDVVLRNRFLKSQEHADNYAKNICKEPMRKKINIFWGLLTVNERLCILKIIMDCIFV